MTEKTIRIEEFGGSGNMRLVNAEVGAPGPGEIRIRHKACGLNFIDIYQRSGVYPLALPVNLGMEASGVIEAVGEGVTHLAEGDRAAYASAPPGAYCTARVMNAMHVCRLPDAIDFDTGAAMMLKGLTTEYLFSSSSRAKPGGHDSVPRRRRGRWSDRLPMGESDGRDPDRDRRNGR